MRKEYVNQNLKEVEEGFKLSQIKPTFITFNELKEKFSKQEKIETLYPSIAKYNQRKVLQRFMELLNEKFGDDLLIESKYLNLAKMIERNGDEIINENNFNYLFQAGTTFGSYLTFSIKNYLYYIQFDDNPLFENASYITTKKIYYFDTYYSDYKGYVIQDYYGGGYNINGKIPDVFHKNCNFEEDAKNLFKYFMNTHFQIENARYISNSRKCDERLTVLKEDNDKVSFLEN